MRRLLVLLILLCAAPSYAMQMIGFGGEGGGEAAGPAYDAKGASGVGTGNLSWTHTPVGTPRGILVFVPQYQSDTDQVSGVTYGGVAMTEVTGSPNLRTTGETMAVYAYFLGSSVPAGAQPVAVTVTGSASKRGISISVTSGGDTAITDVDATLNSYSVANPSATLSLGGVESFAAIGFMSGADSPPECVTLAGWSNRYYSDFGSEVGGVDTYGTVGTTDVTIGHTQAANSYVAIGVAVRTAP